MKTIASPKSFKEDRAFRIVRRGMKKVMFFDFGHPTYYRWFDVDTDYFEAGLMGRKDLEARVKEMIEKEGYTSIK